LMALITASAPLIAGVTDLPRLPPAQDRNFGFLSYWMCLVRICDFALGKRFQGMDRDRPLVSMQMSARFSLRHRAISVNKREHHGGWTCRSKKFLRVNIRYSMNRGEVSCAALWLHRKKNGLGPLASHAPSLPINRP